MSVIGGGDRNALGPFVEPMLPELLEDPLVQSLMASDGVDAGWLRRSLIEIAKRRANRSQELLCVEWPVNED